MGGDEMATNTGKGYRHGSVTGRSQTKAPNGNWVKRGSNGRFMDQKTSSATPFKGVRREK
ncbi:hypothetical protein [Geodermatophilus tzadiensis]|nr:hypothetical protein [Geodermatophilus tzadiensis]